MRFIERQEVHLLRSVQIAVIQVAIIQCLHRSREVEAEVMVESQHLDEWIHLI